MVNDGGTNKAEDEMSAIDKFNISVFVIEIKKHAKEKIGCSKKAQPLDNNKNMFLQH